MSEPNQHIVYSAEEIHRYFSGKMNAAEMHAMEKAALNDPLLSEAMDGYNASNDFRDDNKFAALRKELNELKSNLNVKKPEERNYKGFGWKAAAVLLLAGLAYALYIIKGTQNKEKVLAKKEQSSSTPQESFPADSGSITAKNKTNTLKSKSQAGPAHISKTPALDSTTAIASGSIAIIGNKINPTLLQHSAVAEEDSNATKQELSKDFKKAEYVFSGSVTDDNNKAIPFADLVINNNQFTKTDENGMFNLSFPDSVIRMDVSSVNYFPYTSNLAANNFTTIILALKKSPVKKNTNLTDTFKRSLVEILYKRGVEPKGGWTDYQLFLINQLSNSEYDDGIRVTGETIFSFEVNRLNQPVNFIFEKSINQDVNDALENLILTGPEWKFLENAGIPGLIRIRIIF